MTSPVTFRLICLRDEHLLVELHPPLVTGPVSVAFHCFLYVCVSLFVYCLLLFSYRFSEYYSDCAMGVQHDGHLPFQLPAFVRFISLQFIVSFARQNKYTATAV